MPPSQSMTVPASPPRIAHLLFGDLKTLLQEKCLERQEADLRLRCINRASTERPMRLHLECRDLIAMTVLFRVSHVGGNVYDVHCAVEDGPSRQFSYTLPDQTAPLSVGSSLTQDIATFLLDTLEQQLGRRILGRDDP